MIALTENALKELATIYVAANTPFFFFETLRRSDCVKELAVRHLVTELKESLTSLQQSRPTEPTVILTLFALAAALSLKSDAPVAKFLADLDFSRFRWGREFVFFAAHYSNNDNRETITLRPVITVAAPALSSASTTTVVFNHG